MRVCGIVSAILGLGQIFGWALRVIAVFSKVAVHRLCTLTPFHVDVDIRVGPVDVFEELQREAPRNQTVTKTQLAAERDWILKESRKSFVDIPQCLVAVDHIPHTSAGLCKPNDGPDVECLVQAVPHGNILRGLEELYQATWL